MKFCQPHWDALRKAIDDRGLTPLVAKSGEDAAKRTADQIQNDLTRSNFDPLMGAMWAISGNIMDMLGRNISPAAALSTLGKVCPVCHINKIHEDTCREGNCKLDRKTGYDWMPDRAADDMLEEARRLKLVPGVQ